MNRCGRDEVCTECDGYIATDGKGGNGTRCEQSVMAAYLQTGWERVMDTLLQTGKVGTGRGVNKDEV